MLCVSIDEWNAHYSLVPAHVAAIHKQEQLFCEDGLLRDVVANGEDNVKMKRDLFVTRLRLFC